VEEVPTFAAYQQGTSSSEAGSFRLLNKWRNPPWIPWRTRREHGESGHDQRFLYAHCNGGSLGRNVRSRIHRVSSTSPKSDITTARRLGICYNLQVIRVRRYLCVIGQLNIHNCTSYFTTASYDGHLRVFDYSQNKIHDAVIHAAPITSACLVPQLTSGVPIVATASHDLTAHLTSLPALDADYDTQNAPNHKTLASLHLHTAPLSSISSNATGTHLLTSSWDGLIGVWDTTIPEKDEVPLDAVQDAGNERTRKRRKVAEGIDEEPKSRRKAPTSVMKSHTARVSKVIWAPTGQTALSCGFDSTVRSWDVEMGVCTNTIVSISHLRWQFRFPDSRLGQNASEKPFLDLALAPDGNTALAASTDRFITMYDLRGQSNTPAFSASLGSLPHPSTPSCVCAGPSGSQQVTPTAHLYTQRTHPH
jgi:ribosome biogenesis protein